MALNVGTTKSHWEDVCPLHLRESKGHSKSITLYFPTSSQLSDIKKALGGVARVGSGSRQKPFLLIIPPPAPRGEFSPRPESQFSALNTQPKGIGLS